jgi:hypothetical protein
MIIMKLRELKQVLTRHQRIQEEEEIEVVIRIAKPSVGPIATEEVCSAYFGFDWDRGKFIISPETPLTPKTQKEDIFDRAYDFLYQLSEQKTHKGNPTELAKRAKEIFEYTKQKIKEDKNN